MKQTREEDHHNVEVSDPEMVLMTVLSFFFP